MKKPITLVLALLTYASVAQYNRTIDVNGNNDFLIPSFVISNPQGENITLSMAYNTPGLPRTDYFVITKTKCNGGVIYNNPIFTNNSPTDGMTNVEALMETPQGNLLIAGYHYDDINHVQQPMLVMVDVNGNLGWKKIYYMNQKDIVNSQINKISLCAVAGTQNQYFIVASADSDNKPGLEVVTTVIRIDANNNGNMLLARKYYFSSDFNITTREYPGDIEYSSQSNMYMITGYRTEFNQAGSQNHRMFFFGINAAMNVTVGLKTYEYKSIPIDQDMVYDGNGDNFNVTFTHEKNGYVSTAASIAGFMKVNAAANIVGTPKYYWHNDGKEHNARSISSNGTGGYVIAAGVYDGSLGRHNPALFKINPAGAPTTPLTRYNVLDDAYFGHHATTVDCSNAEGYVLASEQKTDLRSILTDVNGKACGSVNYALNVKDVMPSQKVYTSAVKVVGQQKDYQPKQSPFNPPFRDCIPPGNSYRPTVATAIAQLDGQSTGTALYPTILSVDNAKLNVENNSDAAVKIELYNIAGQLILSNGQVSTGKSELELNAGGNLSQGIYLVKVYDATGSLTSTTKLLITK